MIIFQNPGVLEPAFISTFGASVKSAGAIGYFGTGLKFAIATLLRNNQRIEIYTGGEVFKFSLFKRILRRESFEMVCMNDQQLGFTTQLGKDWKMWMAFREFYCNALDEGGNVSQVPDAPFVALDPSSTSIVIKGELIEREYNERGNNFIIDRQPLAALKGLEIYSGESKHIFYKGVRVGDTDSAFTYNITDKVDLTEDRTIKGNYSYKLSSTITALRDKALIKEIILSPTCKIEHELDYDFLCYPSDEFIAVALDLVKDMGHKVPNSIVSLVNKLCPELNWKEASLTKVQEKMLDKAKDWAAFAGFPVEYKLKIVETLGASILALADTKRNEIIISKQVFDKGTKVLCQALIEEVIHIREGLHDETRELQTFLFQKLMSQLEEIRGEAI